MPRRPRIRLIVAAALIAASLSIFTGCADDDPAPIVVNSLLDVAEPGEGVVTLRSALDRASSNQAIEFDASLDGGIIALSIVGEPRTILTGEVMGIEDTPAGPISYLIDWSDRDYGASALFSPRNVIIDASALPSGITVEWTGGADNPARVLAVDGNLTLINVAVTGGYNIFEDISTDDPDAEDDPYYQPWSLARGGALAVWGTAYLTDCRIHGNRVEGDFDDSRDRGAFGGGVYANVVHMQRCEVSGNSVLGAGAAGGGVYSVGGVDTNTDGSSIERSSITGNRISGWFAYGGGVYNDGGGIGNAKHIYIRNSTIARNLVEPSPDSPPFVAAFGYWRGGGIYMSNGSLWLEASTVVENETHGPARPDELVQPTDLGKPNLAGGVAATIGNAHAVEEMLIASSIIAGNTVHPTGGEPYAHDVFTGSLFGFTSGGFNLLGVIDFSQMLVPVGEPRWYSLLRRHYPQQGDADGVAVEDVLDLEAGITYSSSILSDGVDAGEFAVLYYTPMGDALDHVPDYTYGVPEYFGELRVTSDRLGDFLFIVLDRLEAKFSLTGFSDDFVEDFEAYLASVDLDPDTEGNQPYLDPSGVPILTLADTGWFGPSVTWPTNLSNHPYIHYWHRLDQALLDADPPGLGPETLGDALWLELFTSGPLVEDPSVTILLWQGAGLGVVPETIDQLGNTRPANDAGDIGAIEVP